MCHHAQHLLTRLARSWCRSRCFLTPNSFVLHILLSWRGEPLIPGTYIAYSHTDALLPHHGQPHTLQQRIRFGPPDRISDATSGFTAQVRSAEHTKEENIVNTSSISPNAIAVALCGLAISGYVV